jgi:hypothetical protein
MLWSSSQTSGIHLSGWGMGTGFPAGLISDLVCSNMNCHASFYDLASNLVEKEVLIWLAEMLGFPGTASGLLINRDSCEQRCKIARGYNPRGFVMDERQQSALVTCHQIFRLACFGQGQEKIIGRIG